MDRLKLGQEGEQKGVYFLRSLGYKIICRNFRSRSGEIDIIARKDRNLVFIEVKTRSSLRFGYPEEAVNYRKMASLLKTARYYLLMHKVEIPYRFEVLSIIRESGDKYSFNIIPVEL